MAIIASAYLLQTVKQTCTDLPVRIHVVARPGQQELGGAARSEFASTLVPSLPWASKS
jgi:hypothetical protein